MRPGSAIIPPEVVEAMPTLSGAAVKVAVAIAAFANGEGRAWPRRATLMAKAGVGSTATLAAACRELEQAHIICRTHRGSKATVYTWHQPTAVAPVQKVNRSQEQTGSESEPVPTDRFRNQTGPVQKSNRSLQPIEHDPLNMNTEAPAPHFVFDAELVKGNGGPWPVEPALWERLTAAHPRLDLHAQLRTAAVWLAANPTKRKTRRGMARFVAGWMSRAADGSASRRDFTNPLPQTPDKYANVARKVKI